MMRARLTLSVNSRALSTAMLAWSAIAFASSRCSASNAFGREWTTVSTPTRRSRASSGTQIADLGPLRSEASSLLRTQRSRLPDGSTYFWIARTVTRDKGGFHAPRSMVAIAMGCEAARAGELVYADAVALENPGAVVPVGISCRACERMDCEQRAFPPLQHALLVNPHVRGVSFYAPPRG